MRAICPLPSLPSGKKEADEIMAKAQPLKTEVCTLANTAKPLLSVLFTPTKTATLAFMQ